MRQISKPLGKSKKWGERNMTVEQVSSVLALVSNQLFDMGARHVIADAYDKTIKICLDEKVFVSVQGDATITHRSDCEFPYRLSKYVMGVEFYCITKEVPDGVKS